MGPDDNCAIEAPEPNPTMTAHDIASPDLGSPDVNTAHTGRIPLVDRLPDHVRASLTPAQTVALSDYEMPALTDRHPVDMRMTVPLPGRPMILSLRAGRERLSPERRAIEGKRYPLHTIGNFFSWAWAWSDSSPQDRLSSSDV